MTRSKDGRSDILTALSFAVQATVAERVAIVGDVAPIGARMQRLPRSSALAGFGFAPSDFKLKRNQLGHSGNYDTAEQNLERIPNSKPPPTKELRGSWRKKEEPFQLDQGN